MPPSAERSPTLRDIADATGLSRSAVSLALRDSTRVAEGTRREIQAVAARMGYRRNAVLAHLMAELRNARSVPLNAGLAILNCSPNPRLYDWHTFGDIRAGARRRAEHLGYRTDDFWLLEPGMRPARLRQILQARGLAGLVLIGTQQLALLHDTYEELWRHFPVATAGLVRTQPHLPCACCDHFQTAQAAAERALGHGRRRPGLMLEEALDELTDHRFAGGFLVASNRLPATDRIPILRSGDRDERAFGRWFREHRPDVVLTLHEQVMEWLPALGSRAARTEVLHLDWHPGLEACPGMKQDNFTVGEKVVDLVVTQIHSNERGASRAPAVVLVESTWVDAGPDAAGSPSTRKKGSPQSRRVRGAGAGGKRVPG